MPPTPTHVDPLSNIIKPPPNETAQQRIVRETSEIRARALSEEIDRRLSKDHDALTNKETTRILLLGQSSLPRSYTLQLLSTGQSESGKSTTLKSESMFLSQLSAAQPSLDPSGDQ